MANTDKKETQETQEVKATITPEEMQVYAQQIALRFFSAIPENHTGFGITENTANAIKDAIEDRITNEAGTVTPGDQTFNQDIYIATVTDEDAIDEAIKNVLTIVQEQAGQGYEKGAVLGTLFYILTALRAEAMTVKAISSPGTREEKEADTARRAMEQAERFQSENPERFIFPYELIKAKQYTMINSPVMNELAGAKGKQPINAGEHDVHIFEKGKEITAYVIATYEPDGEITSSIQEAERDVSDAIMSICLQAYNEGKPPVFTEESLYRTMPGRGERPSNEMRKELTRIIEKYRALDMEINATEEMRARGLISDEMEVSFKDHYINARQIKVKGANGRIAWAWQILNIPVMLEYAQMTNHLITVPIKHLTFEKIKKNPATGKKELSGESLPITEQRRAMISYMLRRIKIMEHDEERAKEKLRYYNRRRKKNPELEEKTIKDFKEQNKDNTILFDGIFKAAGADTENREKVRRNREFCFEVLDNWKLTGLIAGYRKKQKGRQTTGITIDYDGTLAIESNESL